MPIYEYRCEKGHTFEVMQRMSDDSLETCPEDGAPVQRVFHPVAIHFKGKGFYNTDYGKKSRGASKDGDGGSKDKEPAKASSSDSKSDSKSESKSESKPSSGASDS